MVVRGLCIKEIQGQFNEPNILIMVRFVEETHGVRIELNESRVGKGAWDNASRKLSNVSGAKKLKWIAYSLVWKAAQEFLK